MKIEEIDKNFKAVERSGSVMQEITLPSDRVDLYGVYYEPSEGRFRRLPNYVAEKVNDGVKNLATNTAGGRIRFATNSSALEIEVGFNGMTRFSHMPLTGSGGVSLVEEDGEKSYFVGIFRPDWNKPTGYSGRINLRGGMRYYTLYFPLYNDVDSLTLYVDEGAELYHGLPYRDEKPILYYGSSITQGGCASRPDTCYQAHIAKWNNIDFINRHIKKPHGFNKFKTFIYKRCAVDCDFLTHTPVGMFKRRFGGRVFYKFFILTEKRTARGCKYKL